MGRLRAETRCMGEAHDGGNQDVHAETPGGPGRARPSCKPEKDYMTVK